MPVQHLMTETSGIHILETGAFEIGTEAFFSKTSPSGDYNHAFIEKKLPQSLGVKVCRIFHFSASLRPPDPRRDFFGRVRPFKTDGLFRVRLFGRTQNYPETTVMSVILKSSVEPQQQGGGGFTVISPVVIYRIHVEFQQAGSGNAQENPSNMELQMSGVFEDARTLSGGH